MIDGGSENLKSHYQLRVIRIGNLWPVGKQQYHVYFKTSYHRCFQTELDLQMIMLLFGTVLTNKHIHQNPHNSDKILAVLSNI